MALQLNRGNTHTFGRMIATSFAIMALLVQPLLALNIPSAFAAAGDTAVTVCNSGCEYNDIQAAVTDVTSGGVINITSDMTVTSQVTIKKPMTINSNYTVTADFSVTSASTDNDNNSVFGVMGTTGVAFNHITADASKKANLHAFNLYESEVTLNNVTAKNSASNKAGVNVNRSQVTATNLHTMNNGYYGVDVDGVGATFAVSGTSVHNETGADIYVDTVGVGSVTDSDDQYNASPYGAGTVYNLKPVTLAQCSSMSTVNSPNLSTWDISETRATGHNVMTSDGVRVYTDSNGSTDKAAAYLPAAFNLADLGKGFGITTVGTDTTPPSLQLTVDLDGNGTLEGNLVSEAASYGSDSLWLSANWSGLDLSGAPTTVVGSEVTKKGGSANDWLAAFPNAKIVAIGYSLGSGVKGDFIIKKLTANCTDYTFVSALPAPTLKTPTDNGYVNSNDFWFDWEDVTGAASYEWQGSQSSSTTNGALDQNVWVGDANHNQPTASTIHSTGASGTWHWQVRAIDANGVKGKWSTIWTMTIDTTKPAVPTSVSWLSDNQTPAVNGYTSVQKGTLSWTDSTPSDVDHYVYKFWTNIPGYFDGQNNAWTTEPANRNLIDQSSTGGSIWTDFDNKEGTYNFCVEAVDKAGNNSGCSATLAITYDTVTPNAPVATLTDDNGNPVTNGYIKTKNFTFNLANAPSEGVVRYQLEYSNDIDGASVRSWNPVDIRATGHMNTLGVYTDNFTQLEGTHHFKFSACDAAGNCSAFSTPFTVTYDKTAPVLTLSYTMNGDGTYTVAGTTTDRNAQVNLQIGTTTYDPITPKADGTWTLTTGKIADGPFKVTATSADDAGNTGTASDTYPFTTPLTDTTPVDQFSRTNTRTADRVALLTGDNGQAILGAQTDAADEGTLTPAAKDDNVKGVSTDKQDSNDKKSSMLGFAWYWWLVLAIIAAFIWWLIAAGRRRKQAE